MLQTRGEKVRGTFARLIEGCCEYIRNNKPNEWTDPVRISVVTRPVQVVDTFTPFSRKVSGNLFESSRNSPPDCYFVSAYKICTLLGAILLAETRGISLLTGAVQVVDTFTPFSRKVSGNLFESSRNSPPDCYFVSAYKICTLLGAILLAETRGFEPPGA